MSVNRWLVKADEQGNKGYAVSLFNTVEQAVNSYIEVANCKEALRVSNDFDKTEKLEKNLKEALGKLGASEDYQKTMDTFLFGFRKKPAFIAQKEWTPEQTAEQEIKYKAELAIWEQEHARHCFDVLMFLVSGTDGKYGIISYPDDKDGKTKSAKMDVLQWVNFTGFNKALREMFELNNKLLLCPMDTTPQGIVWCSDLGKELWKQYRAVVASINTVFSHGDGNMFYGVKFSTSVSKLAAKMLILPRATASGRKVSYRDVRNNVLTVLCTELANAENIYDNSPKPEPEQSEAPQAEQEAPETPAE